MSLQQSLLLFFLILMAIGFPYLIRANVKTNLRKCNNNKDYEGSLKILNGRLYSYLFGKYATLWAKIQLFMATNDIEQLSETVTKVIDGRFTKKEKNQAISTTYFFFINAEDKETCKKLLNCLKDVSKPEEYEFDKTMYRILLEKNSTEDDAQIVLEKYNIMKKQSHVNKNQLGIMEYMLGMHYTNVKDTKEAERYLNHAKLHLKGTPYHAKVKNML